MLPLVFTGITSTNAMIKRLGGKRWRALQKGVSPTLFKFLLHTIGGPRLPRAHRQLFGYPLERPGRLPAQPQRDPHLPLIPFAPLCQLLPRPSAAPQFLFDNPQGLLFVGLRQFGTGMVFAGAFAQRPQQLLAEFLPAQTLTAADGLPRRFVLLVVAPFHSLLKFEPSGRMVPPDAMLAQ